MARLRNEDFEFEERNLRGDRPQVLVETRELTRVLEQSRSTSTKREALRKYRDQILRDERLGDTAVPHRIVITEASPYNIPRSRFRLGWNVVGVQTAGAMTIRIPTNLRTRHLVTIKDERNDAGSNPITIETYNP